MYIRNLFGLTQHPQLTISRIFRQKDKSQFLLVFGLPFYTFMAGVIFIFSAKKLLFGKIFSLGFWAKTSLFFLAFTSFVTFTYLGYWLVKVIGQKKSRGYKVTNSKGDLHAN